jgi:hypothetical protein
MIVGEFIDGKAILPVNFCLGEQTELTISFVAAQKALNSDTNLLQKSNNYGGKINEFHEQKCDFFKKSHFCW